MSIEIINKFNPPSPKYIRKPLPDFKREVDRVRYREKQTQMYIEGAYGLTGIHLFMLQECFIQLRKGQIVAPHWRDSDDEVFHHLEETRNLKMSELIFKRRRWGLTTIGAGILPHYFARIDKGSICNITSKDQPTLFNLFTEKLMICQEALHEDIRGSYDPKYGGSKNQTRSMVGLTLALSSIDDRGNPETKYSKIFCRESSESDDAASKFSGSGVNYIFIDEAPLHKRLQKLMASVTPALMEGFSQDGFALIGGSMEPNMPPEALHQMKLLKENAESYNIRWTFIPGYVGIEGFEVNGHSDIKGATDFILKKRELLDKSPDKTQLNGFIKSHPLTIDELFDSGTTGFWEEPSLAVLNECEKNIHKKQYPITPVEIIKMGNELKINSVNESPIKILEYPKRGVEYMMGVDSIMSGTESGDADGSSYAVIIMKLLDHDDAKVDPGGETSFSPVGFYLHRPPRVKTSYDITANLIRMYNMYGSDEKLMIRVMPEANAATVDHFSTYMDGLGMKHFIMRRPDLSGKGNVDKSKLGIYVTAHGLNWQKSQANIVIQDYGYRFRIAKVIEQLKLLGAANSDLGSAFLAALVGMGNTFDKPAPPPPPPQPRQRRVISNGRYVWVTEQPKLTTSSDETVQYIEFMGIKSLVRPRK